MTSKDHHVSSFPIKEGRKSQGKQKIAIQFITEKEKRQITFSKRKAGILKKAHELEVLTGAGVFCLLAAETKKGYYYTSPVFADLLKDKYIKDRFDAAIKRISHTGFQKTATSPSGSTEPMSPEN